MKKSRKLLALILFVMLGILSLGIPVCGVASLGVNLEGYVVDENLITVYFNTNHEHRVSPEDLKLSIGNTVLPTVSLKALEETEEGVSYLFLVDVSGSMSDEKLANVRDILTQIASTTTSKDNISIFSVGNEAYANPFVSTQEEYKKQIEAISRKSKEDTNLYASIVKGIDVLRSSDKVHDKKCLIILSDGEDDYTTGITRDEVYKKIEKNPVPIYTVAMMGASPSDKKVEASKTLGSFARYSPGGMAIAFGIDLTTAQDIAKQINHQVVNSYVLTADLSGFTSSGTEMLLNLELEIADVGKASDSYPINTSGMGAKPSEATPSPTASPEAVISDEETKQEGPILWLLIGGGAALLALIILLLVLGRKKKKKAILAADTLIELEESPPQETSQVLLETMAMEVTPEDSSPSMDTPHQEPDTTVVFTKMDRINNQVYMSDIFGTLVIGRNTDKADLAFPEDNRLSGIHCTIRYSSGHLFITDMNSTNGTFVNGIPIKQEYRLEKGDIILLGSTQLRVNW